MFKFARIFLAVTLYSLALASVAGLVLWRAEGLRFYSVQTASMAPVLRPGDLVITTRPNSLAIGDIVSYTSPQNPSVVVSHRIYKLEPSQGYIVTKGDNLRYPDPPTSYSSITGKAAKAVPKAGYFLNFLHNPAGLIALVYIPGLIICAFELSRLIQHFSRRRYGLEA